MRAALLEGEEAARAWQSWKESCGDVEATAAARLLPLVYRNLAGAGAADPRLKAAYERSWASNQRLLAGAVGAIEALEAAGLETMALKGAALTALHYRDGGARPMGDVDILVHTRRAGHALDALRHAG